VYSTSGTKTFVIDHPDDPENKYLVHACLEGPEAGVYYRGTSSLSNGSVDIDLPEYARKLASEYTVTVTQKYTDGKFCQFQTTNVTDNKFTVYGSNDSAEFFWSVLGKRETIKVEVDKKDVEVRGTGPYRYLEM
jgi:hypothetical protein